MINLDAIRSAASSYKGAAPFDHVVIDDFLQEDVARALETEFPAFNSPVWRGHNNPIEVKKLLNDWDKFGARTYRFFDHVNSPAFVRFLSETFGIAPLYPDQGLHGGGWHIHAGGGRLNPHLDYSIHPKLGLQRKLNLIVYLNPDWRPEWGGSLGLWEQDPEQKKPGRLVKKVDTMFNRAVLFDTTQNSWHGLPDGVSSPEGQMRKSLAVYYLTDPGADAEERGRALFAPTPEQESDPAIQALIKARATVSSGPSPYTSFETGGTARRGPSQPA